MFCHYVVQMTSITIIGAGSAAFSLALTRDLCATPGLWGSTVTLMDISPGRLEIAKTMVEQYRKEAGAELTIRGTTDRRAALKGADFVICCVKIGGYGPLEAERALAEKHGYYRGIGDRVSCYYGGVGAYHQLKFFLDLARDMEAVCPDALLIETANPVFEGATLLTRHTKIRTVGICHGHMGWKRLAEVLGLEEKRVSVQVAGLNHCVWLTRFTVDGRDAYPLIDRWIQEDAERFWASPEYRDAEFPWLIEQISPGAVDAYRLYGLFPIGDATRSASPWWHHTDLDEKRKWYGRDGGFDSETGWSAYLSKCRRAITDIEHAARAKDIPLLTRYPPGHSGEQHIPLIDAMINGRELILELNIPNRGAVPGIADDVVVEIPALVTAGGPQGVMVGTLPSRLMDNVILPRVLRMESIVDAFMAGDRTALVLQLMDDHRTGSFAQAQGMIDALLSQPWNTEAAAHYRAQR